MATSARSRHEFRDLEGRFREGHRDYPQLCAQGCLGDEWLLKGQGRGRFRLLAKLAAKAAGYSGMGHDCEFWLNAVKNHLIKHDPEGEYLKKLPATVCTKPAPWRHPRAAIGNDYIIRAVFAASADCCLNLTPCSEHVAAKAAESRMLVQPTIDATRQVKPAQQRKTDELGRGEGPLKPTSKALSRRLVVKPVRRNARRSSIDKALQAIAEARPKSHKEVFGQLDKRVQCPYAAPFDEAGGWLAGFQKDPPRARSWLSKAWSRLGLPTFPRGPK